MHAAPISTAIITTTTAGLSTSTAHAASTMQPNIIQHHHNTTTCLTEARKTTESIKRKRLSCYVMLCNVHHGKCHPTHPSNTLAYEIPQLDILAGGPGAMYTLPFFKSIDQKLSHGCCPVLVFACEPCDMYHADLIAGVPHRGA